MPGENTAREPWPRAREQALAWLAEFVACVRARDTTRARPLFADDVVAFGTLTRRMANLDELESRQWRPVWDATRDFRFDLDALRLAGSDELLVVAATWSSESDPPSPDATRRRGRSTLVLARRDGRLLCVHSHFSLDPDS